MSETLGVALHFDGGNVGTIQVVTGEPTHNMLKIDPYFIQAHVLGQVFLHVVFQYFNEIYV